MFCVSILFILYQSESPGEYYDRGQFERALEGYEEMIDKGFVTPNIFLNIGNCYYRMEEYGRALLNYRRAWFLAPSDENVQHNLELFIDRDRNPNPFIQFFTGVVNGIPLRVFASLLIISLSLFLIFVSIKLIQTVREINFPVNPLLFITAIFLVFSVSGFSIWFSRMKSDPVVITQTTRAYSGPGMDYKQLIRVDEAEEGYFIRRSNGWWLIQLDSGEGGWIDSTRVEKVLSILR